MGQIGTERREVEFVPLTGEPGGEPVRRAEPAGPSEPAPAAPDPART